METGSTPRTVLLVNTKTRRFSETLSLVRDEMLRRNPGTRFRYFVRDLTRLTPLQIANQTSQLVRACATADIVVCETDSLPADVAKNAPTAQRRVLVLPPKADMIDGTPVEPVTTLPYTDIVVQNERFADYFSALYPSGGDGAIRPIGLPVLDAFASPHHRLELRDRLHDVFPHARGRKIISLSMHFDARASLGNIDLPQMARDLAEKYVLLLHAPGVFPALAGYGMELADFVCNSEALFAHHEVMAMADVLVSTRFGDAVYFSATGDRFVYFSRNTDTAPDALTDFMITQLDEIPRLLTLPPGSPEQSRFRADYVAPNLSGNTERLVDLLLTHSAVPAEAEVVS